MQRPVPPESSDQIGRASGFKAAFSLEGTSPLLQIWDLSGGLRDIQDTSSLRSFWHKHLIFFSQPLLPDLSFSYFMQWK